MVWFCVIHKKRVYMYIKSWVNFEPVLSIASHSLRPTTVVKFDL